MASKRYTQKVKLADAVSEAWGALEGLGEEMREAHDNTPEALQSSPVGEARGEAADNLEGLSEPVVPDSLAEREVEVSRVRRTPKQAARLSRPARRDDAVMVIAAVIDHLDKVEGEEAEALRDELDSLQSDAEDVDFPGMFG